MFRIGDFARLGRVSVKTLHHYDEVGLLRPALVDRDTGYRFYEPDQLTTMHRILTLKDLGFSLQEIGEVLGQGRSAAQITDILTKKVREAQQAISREQVRLSRILDWLNHMQEDVMPKYDVLLKALEPQLVASMRGDASDLGECFAQVARHIESNGVKEAGPGFILYHDPELADECSGAEAAYPISAPIPETERIRVYELPGVEKAACLVYKGTHENMGEASRTIAQWIQDNGYRISGPNRVVFLDCGDDETEPGVCVVETQFPVEKRA